MGQVYATRAGLLLHLTGNSRLVTSTVFDFGLEHEVVDTRLAKHRGALLAWDLNPAAYWCTGDCRCIKVPTAIDFRLLRQAVAAGGLKVTADDCAWGAPPRSFSRAAAR